MKIAVDATVLWGKERYSGVEKVVDRLVRRLLLEPRGHTFRVFVPADFAGFEEADNTALPGINSGICRLPFAGARRLRRIFWQQFELPRLLQGWEADLLFAPAYVLPVLSACPTALLVHDLHGLRLDRTRPENFLHHRLLLLPSIRRAASIVAPTTAVLDLVRPLARVNCPSFAAPWGIDPVFCPLPYGGDSGAVSRLLAAYQLQDCSGYLLFVGNLERRKGLELLLRAFHSLTERLPDVALLIVGKDRGLELKLRAQLNALGLSRRVHFTGFVPTDRLVNLYQHAEALILPSIVEGFGIPPLEAMACGCPVVAVEQPAARETLDGCALFCDPDAAELADAITQAITPERRQLLVRCGLDWSAQFTWERACGITWQALEAACRDKY